MTASAVGVDVGNSRVKVAIRCDNSIAKVFTVSHGCQEILELIEAESVSLTGKKPAKWILAGVVPVELARLSNVLSQHGYRTSLLNDRARIGMNVSVDEPAKVGLDRLLAAKAAYHFSQGGPCMVVDAGTALTINWVDRIGTFLGGSIQPGWNLMAKSLGNGTAALPEVGPINRGSVDWPAKNTIAAIQTGLMSAMVGAVERCWKTACEMDRDASCWITGGCGEALAELLPDIARFHPNLVLEGMFLAAG